MNRHTAEPWKVYERKLPYIIGGVEKMHTERSIGTEHDDPQLKAPFPICVISTGLGVNKGELHHFVSLREADARHIVACVNACAGISEEALNSVGKWSEAGQETLRELHLLREQSAMWKDESAVANNLLIEAKNQRDVAWEELREIREAVTANPEESTADEVRRLRKQYGDMLTTLQAIARGEYCEGEEVEMAKAVIPKVTP